MEEAPRYKLIEPFYADDTWFDRGTEIEFRGVPNEWMEPLNAPAEAAMTAYLQQLEEGRVASGRISRRLEDIVEQEIRNRPRETGPNGAVVTPKYNPEAAVLGNMTKAGGTKPPPAVGAVKVVEHESQKRPAPVVIGANKDLANA